MLSKTIIALAAQAVAANGKDPVMTAVDQITPHMMDHDTHGIHVHPDPDYKNAVKVAEKAGLTGQEIADAGRVLRHGVDRRDESRVREDLLTHGIHFTKAGADRSFSELGHGHMTHNELIYAKHRAEEAYAATKNPDITAQGFLSAHDGVGVSFWIISIAMVATTVFLLSEASYLGGHWKTSITCGSLVTLIAGVHYFYMRRYWITFYASPIVYRYIDWSLTVPLQMVEFYLILKAVKPDVSTGMFWRLLLGTVCMLTFGYLGENRVINAWLGFALGMAGWGFILSEVFVGEAGNVAGEITAHVKSAFASCRFIVSVGWSIYPLGYFFGYLLGAVDDEALNLIYNLADFVNKIAFVLAIWAAAKADYSEGNKGFH